MRILAGAFISFEGRFVEFIDPSVRDLMNSVIRNVPQNGVDIIRGAIDMTQVQAVWRLSKGNEGAALRSWLRAKLNDLALGVGRSLAADSYFRQDGASGLFAPLLEERLETLVNIVEATGSSALAALVEPSARRMMSSGRNSRPI